MQQFFNIFVHNNNMKIKQENQFGLAFFDNGSKNELIEIHIRDYEKKTGKTRDEWPDSDKHRVRFVERLFEGSNNKNLVVSEKAKKLIEGIQIDPAKMSLKIFAEISNKKRTFLLGKERFYRFMVEDDEIFCALLQTRPVEHGNVKIDYFLFPINTKKGYIDVDFEQLGTQSIEQFYEDIIYFFQLLVFTELAETEIVELQPTQKIGTRKSGKVFNDSNKNIIVVDANWNKYVIMSGEFQVRSHFRWQPCGTNRQSTKLVFIEEFKKKGYSRKPTKELVCN